MANQSESLNPIIVFKETFKREMRRYSDEDAARVQTFVEGEVEATKVSPTDLLKNFDNILNMLDKMFTKARDKFHGVSLESMEVNLEVSAEGQIGFLGTGIKATGTSSFKLIFSATQDAKP